MPAPDGSTSTTRLDDPLTALDRAAWFALRALLVVAGAWAALAVFDVLRVVLIPLAVATIVAAALRPIARRWSRRLGATLAAVAVVLGVLAVGVGVAGLASWAVVGSAGEDLAPALEDGRDAAERWLREGPLQLDQAQIDDFVSSAEGTASSGSGAGAVEGAMVAGEVLAGAILALFLSVFAVRDLDRAVDGLARRSPRPRRARAAVEAALDRLRGYLLAVVALGTIEAVIIGGTVAIVASPGLGAGIAGLTFLAAFVPLVGAIVAGVVAVVAVLATGGVVPALITAGVALAVQQLDNDLLAPVLYGRAASLHPVAILVSVTAGTALAGIAGAVLAVPLVTAVVAARRAWTDDDVDVGATSGTPPRAAAGSP